MSLYGYIYDLKQQKHKKINKLRNSIQTLKRVKPPIMIVENESCIVRFQPPERLQIYFVT